MYSKDLILIIVSLGIVISGFILLRKKWDRDEQIAQQKYRELRSRALEKIPNRTIYVYYFSEDGTPRNAEILLGKLVSMGLIAKECSSPYDIPEGMLILFCHTSSKKVYSKGYRSLDGYIPGGDQTEITLSWKYFISPDRLLWADSYTSLEQRNNFGFCLEDFWENIDSKL